MNSQKEFLGRGWAFPFRFDSATGRVGFSEFEENIRQCITIILATRPGERQMLPDFGCRIHELLFSPNTSTTSLIAEGYVREALAKWEPRVECEQVSAQPDPSGAIRVEVVYRIIATDSVHSAVHVVSNSDQR
ncbi:MAG: GPW/gp25 family protein [Myxococcota bacterium]